MLASEDWPASHVLRRPDARWLLSLYPFAGEAGGSSSRPFVAAALVSVVPLSILTVPARKLLAVRGEGPPLLCRQSAGPDGHPHLCRCGLPRSPVVRADVADFFRRLRTGLGGDPLPYLWVPEWHPGGHGLHLHYAMGQFVPRSTLVDAWGRRFVHIKGFTNLPLR